VTCACDYRRHERWWATPVVKSSKLVVSSMKLTKRVASFVVFLISSMALPWALKTRTSKSHVAMRANEPATLLAEATRYSWLGNWYKAGSVPRKNENRMVRGALLRLLLRTADDVWKHANTFQRKS
jgi:hypothetical protein